jgi:hypothetical protein
MTIRIVAASTDAGIALRLYDGETLAQTIPLTPRRALLLGADLVRLAAEGELTIEKAQLPLGGGAAPNRSAIADSIG